MAYERATARWPTGTSSFAGTDNPRLLRRVRRRMPRDGYPKEAPDGVPPEHEERARELQLELLVLEARLESANFEDKEAFRRAINEREDELESLRDGSE